MKNTAYVVTADGYPSDGYGSEIYLIGVFKDKVSANDIKAKYPDLDITITEVEMGKEYPMKRCENLFFFENNNYLGGYAE